MTEENTDTEYYIHTEDMIDTSGSIADEDEVIDIEFEKSAVFRRLADDIYETPEAGIREPLTNAITSVRRVFDEKDENDGVIEIKVQDGEQATVTLRDNGEGITKEVLNEVLTVIGRSNATEDGDLSGQYGIGFLASYKLVGTERGGFMMWTNPRETYQEPYSGLFKPGTFEPDKDNKLPQLLDDDEYGTIFQYHIKPSISVKDIREWVEKHAKWSPVPVVYEEYDEDGNQVMNEDYHAESLKDLHKDEVKVTIENDYYEVIMSPSAENTVILISSPAKMSGTGIISRNIPWSFDIKLKYENGIIYRGPNKGKIPVKNREYDMMSDNRKEKYIPESEMSEDDKRLPQPTGTRERIQRDRSFLRDVKNKLVNKFEKRIEKTLDNFDPKTDNLENLDDDNKEIIYQCMSSLSNEHKGDQISEKSIKSCLSKLYDYDEPSDALIEFFESMIGFVKVYNKNNGGKEYPKYSVHKLATGGTRVFMCVSKNSWKLEAVSRSSEQTNVVLLDNASQYEPYEKHLGWSKLKSIKKSNATEILDLSDEERASILSEQNNNEEVNIKNKNIVVHIAGGGRNTMKKQANVLVEFYNRDQNRTYSGRYCDLLLIFPRSDDENLSDNYDLANNRCTIASCHNDKVINYLTDKSENIIKHTSYKEWILDKKCVTSDKKTCKLKNVDFNQQNVVFYPVQLGKTVASQKVLEKIHSQLTKEDIVETQSELVAIDPVTMTHISNASDQFINSNISVLNPDTSYDNKITILRHSTVDLFCKNVLTEDLYNKNEVSGILENYDKVCEDLLSRCNLIKEIYNDHKVMTSIQTNNENQNDSVSLPKHRTKHGAKTLKETYNMYESDRVIIHCVDKSRYPYFTDEYILNSAPEKLRQSDVPDLSDRVNNNSIYIPVLRSTYDAIEEYIHNESIIIGVSRFKNKNSVRVDDKKLYGAMYLESWSYDEIHKLLSSVKFKYAIEFVDNLKDVEDEIDFKELNDPIFDVD